MKIKLQIATDAEATALLWNVALSVRPVCNNQFTNLSYMHTRFAALCSITIRVNWQQKRISLVWVSAKLEAERQSNRIDQYKLS